ncbi:MAG: hypothetical protein HYT37_02930 [Candidatus Sungbacteria bacterium]|nr:hypothetical protein [Candidatus Sungbacteria bacterium]
MVIFTVSLLSSAPVVNLFFSGETAKGYIILMSAIFFGTASFVLADYWHKRNIHATPYGNIISLLTFVTGIITLWQYGFYFWVPLILCACFISFGYIIAKNEQNK